MSTPRFVASALALALAACGDDFDPKSLLIDYRVLAIRADPAELVYDPLSADAPTRTTLQVIDFDPATVQAAPATDPPKYTWSWCAVSKGTSGGYACIEPLRYHIFGGNGASATFDAAAQLPALMADFALLAQATGANPSNTDPRALGIDKLPVQILLEVEHASVGRLTAAKTLNVYLPPDEEGETPRRVNQNPVLSKFTIGGIDACAADGIEDGCFVAAPLGSPALTLAVEIEGGSSEACTSTETENGVCDPDTGREILTFSWFTTAGELKFGFTNAETLENELKLPKSFPDDWTAPTMPVRLFVAVRDGRGGVDVRSADFQLTEAPDTASPDP